MSNDTIYVDKSAPLIFAAWLNDVNNAVYHAVGTGVGGSPPASPTDVLTNLGLTGSGGATLINWTQVGVGAVSRSLSDALLDEVRVTDFMSAAQKIDSRTNTGALDLTAAIQAAIDALVAAGGGKLIFPAGTFRVNGTITKVSSRTIRIVGAGLNATQILKYNDSDLFVFTVTAGAQPTMAFEELTITPMSVRFTTGTAITVTSLGIVPSARFRNLFIGAPATGEFKTAIKLVNCVETQFDGVVTYGIDATNMTHYSLSCTIPATVPKWMKCSGYNGLVFASLLSTTNPGIEGTQFYGCEAVGFAQGVVFNNTVAGFTYFPPQLTWIGGHMNCSVECIRATTMNQVFVQGALLYLSGSSGAHIHLFNVGELNIQDNEFVTIGGTHDAILMQTGTAQNGGLIKNNLGNLAAGRYLVNLTATNYQNLTISQNRNISAGGGSVFVSGTVDPTIDIRDNYPADPDDGLFAVAAGVTMSLAGKRTGCKFVNVGAGTFVCTTLTGGNYGETIYLYAGAAGLTIQHNGAVNGFILKGGVNHVYGVGDCVILQKANGGWWTQVSS